MEPFTVHTGNAVPLRRANVDTDQIIPSDYLKRVSRSGFADGLFRQWRAEGGFVLDDPAYAGASILLAGPDFGTGSSREHAVWALQDAGFRAVISSRIADIFRSNALKSGLLAVVLSAPQVDELMDRIESDPALEVTIDLLAQEIRVGADVVPFVLEASSRRRLVNGLDDIAMTMLHIADISAFEAERSSGFPQTSAAARSI